MSITPVNSFKKRQQAFYPSLPKMIPFSYIWLLAFALTAPAHAENPESSDSAENKKEVEEIFVNGLRQNDGSTARMPLSVREIPQSVSLLSREFMDLTGISDINDVMMNVTGVNVTLYDTQRPLYFSRGFQITDFQVDGIPTYSSSTNQEYDTALYQSIEVIRGANGLFTGVGKPSGTVNMIRKRPEKEFTGSLSAQAGSWNLRRGVGDVSVPLTAEGRVRSRIVVAYQDSDSFRDRYSEDKLALLGIVEADLTDNTTIALGYQKQDNNPEGTIWGTIPIFAADGSLARLPVSTSFAPNWTEWQRESNTVFADIEHRFSDDWVLRTSFNRTEGDFFSLRVYADGFPDRDTGQGVELLGSVGSGYDTRDGVDLQITGSYSAFGRKHEVMLGGSVFQLDARNHVYTMPSEWSYAVPDAWNFEGSAPQLEYAKVDGPARVTKTDQSGFYAANRINITGRLSLIGGARVNAWKSGATEIDEEVTPYAGMVYDVTESLAFYASYTDIFSPQNVKDKDNQPLEPAVGINLEAGVKAEFLSGQLIGTMAVFNTKQDNYAVPDATQDGVELDDGSRPHIGVDGTESEGVELSVDGFLSSRWMIKAGYTYVDTTRHETDRIWTNLPEHSVQFSTHYQLTGAMENLTLGGGLNWQDKTVGYGVEHPQSEEGVTFEQDPYALVNFYATWRFSTDLTATLSATNLFDEVYWANIDYANYGEPRNMSLSLTWRY